MIGAIETSGTTRTTGTVPIVSKFPMVPHELQRN
jgi:hypothetical protein